MSGHATGETLRIRLLGGFELSVGSTRVPEDAFRLRKAKSLLKLLALAADKRMHRTRVGALLWPERDFDSVANNLHQAVYVARRALDAAGPGAGACLALHEDNLSLGGPTFNIEVDVDRFESAARRAREQRTSDAYASALEWYGGELLPEDDAEAWSRARRQALEELHVGLLLELCELHAGAGRRDDALHAAQKAVLHNPLHEGAQRALMRCFVADGRRQQALEQYASLRESLKKELEAKPDPETRRLYHEILTQTDPEPTTATATATAPAQSSAARSQPLPARAAVRSALPLPLTSFIGRERECDEVKRLLARSRLVTLTGPGGCGKTRLALEAAAKLQHEIEDGVLLVELAPVTDEALVAQELATALGIELRSEREPVAAVVEQIGQRDLLVLLDNCEHVIASCAQLVQRLLRACPELRVLATSREPLRVLGEITWRVPSRALPNLNEPLDLEHMAGVEAVRLFVERAGSVAHNFVLKAENAAAVAQVCLRLDGMPLAIELAAARTAALSPAQIAERLRDSFSVLGQGNRGALTRQQTLVATIGWSYDLLEPEERALFRRLSLFAGSFSLDAVEQICAGDGLERPQIADLLARLVDKSLVLPVDEIGEPRYRLLETVKQYGVERLDAANERAPLEARLLAFYLELAAANDPDLGCPSGFADRLEREHDNLRAALALGLSRDPEAALRLGVHMCAFWMARGYFAEGTRFMDEALAASPARSALRARALLHRGGLAVRRGQVELICATGHESIAIFGALDDRRAQADALQQTAMLHCMLDELAAGERLLGESKQLAERLGDAAAIATLRFSEGVNAHIRADYARACELFREAHLLFAGMPPDPRPVFPAHGIGLAIIEERPGRPRCYYEDTFFVFRRVSTAAASAWALATLAITLRSAGRLDEARAPLAEALSLFEQLDDKMGYSMALNQSGNLSRSLAEFERGRAQLEQTVSLRRELRDRRGVGMSLCNLAVLEASAGDRARAQSLLEQAQALFTRTEDMPGLNCVQMALGSIELAAGAWGPARAALESARLLSARQATKRVAGWLSITLAEVALDQGEPPAAARYLAEARQWLASSHDARAARRIAELESR
jgi:predicted ATPase/DNA-binding SARP family transcriptional activator